MNDWIKVSDELPPVGKCIMIYSKNGSVAEGMMESDKTFTQFRWNAKNVNVTHWKNKDLGPNKE